MSNRTMNVQLFVLLVPISLEIVLKKLAVQSEYLAIQFEEFKFDCPALVMILAVVKQLPYIPEKINTYALVKAQDHRNW